MKVVSFDGQNLTSFVPTAFVGAPHALAFDWISRNLYWSNIGSNTIEVMRLGADKPYRRVLLSNSGHDVDVSSAVSLCVDPIRG